MDLVQLDYDNLLTKTYNMMPIMTNMRFKSHYYFLALLTTLLASAYSFQTPTRPPHHPLPLYYPHPLLHKSFTRSKSSHPNHHHGISIHLSTKKNVQDCDCSGSDTNNNNDTTQPVLLQPYLPAMDPNYSTNGPIGLHNFILSRGGPPTIDELSNEQMLRIVKLECSDLEVNTLVWKCLGYRFDSDTISWSNEECFPKWKEQYPTPPDFIGMKRVYSREVDSISLRSNQALVRSIPVDNKQSLKAHLKPLGWKGYQYNELTPNKTRRAQCANWLIYYREELFGYTIEELHERRRLKRELAEQQQQQQEQMKIVNEGAIISEMETTTKRSIEGENNEHRTNIDDGWKPPVKEVF